VAKRESVAARDQRVAAVIVDELEKGGALNDPRHYSRPIPLSEHVRNEVRRSLARVRMLRAYKSATSDPTLADFRAAARGLRKVAFTDEQQTAIQQLEAVRQEPPERADALKYRCAAEMYFLMEGFSAKGPTGSDGGPFQTGTGYIYEAVTGRASQDMKRACALVLRERRRPSDRISR
jgi:hypothetical protein